MVDSWQPERAEATHSLVAGEHIHDRVLQRKAHVQRAGDVRRRDHNREHGSVRIGIDFRSKIAVCLPTFIMLLFCCSWFVLFWYVHSSVVTSQLSVVSCQLSVVSGQLSVVSGQLSVVGGQWS